MTEVQKSDWVIALVFITEQINKLDKKIAKLDESYDQDTLQELRPQRNALNRVSGYIREMLNA
jgi:hypothetical protein